MDKGTVNVYKDGKAVTIDKNSLAVYLRFGYTRKKMTKNKEK